MIYVIECFERLPFVGRRRPPLRLRRGGGRGFECAAHGDYVMLAPHGPVAQAPTSALVFDSRRDEWRWAPPCPYFVVAHHGGAGGTGGRRGGDDTTTVRRQSGQVEWEPSHMSTHSAWKPWPHWEKNLASSPSSSSTRHTAHSTPSSSSSFATPVAVLRLYTVTGSDRSTSGLTPPPLPPSPPLPERRRCGRPCRPRTLEKNSSNQVIK
uniref:Uncharacterized protein n=1 Tax=Oryza rufipogon TaxID=4529 RepID=A0A0E0RBU8_ORYRU